jgi:hypothetical protein
VLECSELTRELTRDFRRSEIEPLQHQRHDIALVSQSSLNLAAQPIYRVVATLQCGRGQQNKIMCPCTYVSEDDALEVATGDTQVIKEHIIAVVCQVLKNSERPRNIGAAITEKQLFQAAIQNEVIEYRPPLAPARPASSGRDVGNFKPLQRVDHSNRLRFGSGRVSECFAQSESALWINETSLWGLMRD